MEKYKFYFKAIDNIESTCYAVIEKIEDKTVVVLIHDAKTIGTSVTNYFKEIATLVYYEILKAPVNIDNIVWIEYVTDNTYVNQKGYYRNVILNFENNVFKSKSDDAILNNKQIENFLDNLKSEENIFNKQFAEVTFTNKYKDYFKS